MTDKFLTYRVAENPESTVEQFVSAIAARNLIQYGVVDHRHDMAQRGVNDPPWAYTVIFGNPAAGAQFMKVTPTVVTDMPIRVGIYGDVDHTEIVYHKMEDLLMLHDERLRPAGAAADRLVALLCEEVGANPGTPNA